MLIVLYKNDVCGPIVHYNNICGNVSRAVSSATYITVYRNETNFIMETKLGTTLQKQTISETRTKAKLKHPLWEQTSYRGNIKLPKQQSKLHKEHQARNWTKNPETHRSPQLGCFEKIEMTKSRIKMT